jgi:P27 family predicted phage terminase small subunit
MGGPNSGRAKKPALVKKLEGNRGRRKIQDEPKPDGLPRMPEYFNDEQKEAWMATLKYLPKGLVTGADTAACEVFAVAWATWREAQRALNPTGQLVRGSEGQPVRNPWKAIARQASGEMNMFGAALGMSPLARTRLVASDDGAHDPMELLLGMDDAFTQLRTQ